VNDRLQRRINHTLAEHGFGRLDDPGLVHQLAFFVRSHEHFRSLLVTADPEERRNMYEAMSPYLRFKPRTFDEYMTEARADAEARRLPIEQPDGTLREFEVPEIKTDHAVDTPSGPKASE
jgi:hypothetical protein